MAANMNIEKWESKVAELMVGIRDVRVDIREIKSNFSWMNSRLAGFLEVVHQITFYTSGLDTRLEDAEEHILVYNH